MFRLGHPKDDSELFPDFTSLKLSQLYSQSIWLLNFGQRIQREQDNYTLIVGGLMQCLLFVRHSVVSRINLLQRRYAFRAKTWSLYNLHFIQSSQNLFHDYRPKNDGQNLWEQSRHCERQISWRGSWCHGWLHLTNHSQSKRITTLIRLSWKRNIMVDHT